MKKLLLILIILLQGCIRDNPKIRIVNDGDTVIDSIEVFAHPLNKTVFRNIKPHERKNGIISFKGIPKQDGGIGMYIYYEGKPKLKGLSYYTNGGSLDYGFIVTIENDTILVESPSFMF